VSGGKPAHAPPVAYPLDFDGRMYGMQKVLSMPNACANDWQKSLVKLETQ